MRSFRKKKMVEKKPYQLGLLDGFGKTYKFMKTFKKIQKLKNALAKVLFQTWIPNSIR